MVHKSKLNREMIVREAIALVQEGGLDALTLRALASRLDVRAPSLARHVGDKGQLVSLISSTIFMEALADIPPGRMGADWLLAYGHALRERQRVTRDVTAMIASAPHHAEMEQATAAALTGAMTAAGLSGQQAMSQQAAIQALVTGWMVFETSPRATMFRNRLPHTDAFDQALAALVRGFAS